MLHSLFFTVFMAAASVAVAQDCNICGQGNSIQFPTGIVEFTYQGKFRKNNCQTWQDLVKNPNVISDSFCRNEMLQYTVEVCRCTTPSGALVADTYSSPTSSPAPHGANSGPAPASPPATPASTTTGIQSSQSTVGNTTSNAGSSSMQVILWWSSVFIAMVLST
jgi:hypothetical protein